MMRVLLVEDDVAVCRAIKNVLTHSGYAASCVGKMMDCPKAVVDFDPHIVILDLGLPDTRGTETLEAMTGLIDDEIPIIVFSADSMWRDECIRLGALEYMVKGDFTPMDIPGAIDKVLARQRLSNAINASKRAADGETSWPGQPVTDPGKVADRLMSMGAELKLLASGG
jgi:DNA-binding response OmpR family regulator